MACAIRRLKRLRCVFRETRRLIGSENGINPGFISATNIAARSNMEAAEMRSINSNRASVNGVKLHYDKTGVGEHIVLLLPGALGSSRTDFLPQLERMNKEKFTLIAWDPQGYGASNPPERTWPDKFLHRDAEDAVALMKELNHPRFSMLGWSDGGITGLIIAAKYPELIKKLVVWGSNAYVTEEDVKAYENVQDLEKWPDAVKYNYLHVYGRPLLEQLSKEWVTAMNQYQDQGIKDVDKWSTRMKKSYVDIYGEDYFRKHWAAWVTSFSQYSNQNPGDICKEDVKKIKCPTLVIHGQKDPMVGQAHADYLHNNITGSRLHLMPEGKHNLHLRFVEDFNKIAEDFLLEK